MERNRKKWNIGLKLVIDVDNCKWRFPLCKYNLVSVGVCFLRIKTHRFWATCLSVNSLKQNLVIDLFLEIL